MMNLLQTLVKEILSKEILSDLKNQVTSLGLKPNTYDISLNWDELHWVWICASYTATNEGDTDPTFSWLIPV